jgi:hypothetical protein
MLWQIVNSGPRCRAVPLNCRAYRGERPHIEKLRSWPWEPGTARAVVTLLPLVLWAIQRMLDRLAFSRRPASFQAAVAAKAWTLSVILLLYFSSVVT